MIIDNQHLSKLSAQAKSSPRFRESYDLGPRQRTTASGC